MGTIANNVKARVLNAVSAIDPIVTNASNRTVNFELPLFVGDDKPAWLVDWNNTMVAIDLLLKDIEASGNDNTVAINQLETRMNEMDTLVATAQSDILTNAEHIQQNKDDIADLNHSIDVIQDDLIAQNTLLKQHTEQITNLQKQDELIDTQITNLNEKDAQIDEQIGNLNQKDAQIDEQIGNLNTKTEDIDGDINGINTTLQTQRGQITELQTDVTTAQETADQAQSDANSASETATTAIGLANEGISKGNNAQESANTAQSTINEYIRQHSNYQYAPSDTVKGVSIEPVTTSGTIRLPNKNITQDVQGVKKVKGLLMIKEIDGEASASGHGLAINESTVFPFHCNLLANNAQFVLDETETTEFVLLLLRDTTVGYQVKFSISNDVTSDTVIISVSAVNNSMPTNHKVYCEAMII